MLSNIYRLLIVIFVGFGCVSCNDTVDVPESPQPNSPGSFTLTFRNSEMSRSTDSDNSEDLIDNLYIGLYPLTAYNDDAAAVWANFNYLGVSKSKTVTIQLSDAMTKALFDNTDGKKCRIFALANVPEGVEVPSYASINTMKSLAVGFYYNDNKLKDVQDSFVMFGGNENVTYSESVQGQKGKATGIVNLTRAAAKINLNVSFPEKVEIKDEAGKVIETWQPLLTNIQQNIHVSLNNGVKEATAVPAGKPSSDEAYFNSNLKTFEYKTGEYPYKMVVPFYTYPNSWTESIEETRKTTMTLIVPWYRNNNTNDFHTFYYQVPVVPADTTALRSNRSYTVNLKVGMLGSLVPDTPVKVDNVSYQVVDWGEKEVGIPIEDYRYLVVNPNVYTFNNETNMSIPYYTSHPVEVVNINITYERFNFVSEPSNSEVGRVVNFTIDDEQINNTNEKYPDQKICTSSLDNIADQAYLNIYHPLNLWTPYDKDGNEVHLAGHNKTYANLDELEAERKVTADSISFYKPIEDDAFSKYTITCTLRHIDRPEYSEEITIYQYPAIYIEADRNPASKPDGNVFVNSYTNKASNSSGGVFGSIFGLIPTEDIPVHNMNPNMYIINITSLSQNNTFSVKDEATEHIDTYNYVINDPRAKFCTNGLSGGDTPTNYSALITRTSDQGVAGSWCEQAKSLYPGTERRLEYYYPTLEDGSVKNVIAPKFRIASSWGVTVGILRTYARRRCALYQEQQYPAGRWRIPTLAEFSYINKLSNEGKIPILFTPNVVYWTSEGLYKGTSDGEIIRVSNQEEQKAVRAVYDEWYWNQYPQYSITPDDGSGNFTYTLGDVPRGK